MGDGRKICQTRRLRGQQTVLSSPGERVSQYNWRVLWSPSKGDKDSLFSTGLVSLPSELVIVEIQRTTPLARQELEIVLDHKCRDYRHRSHGNLITSVSGLVEARGKGRLSWSVTPS